MTGSLLVITGCMFSGKTGEFQRRLRLHKLARRKIQVFSPENDTRYGVGKVVSHDKKEIPSLTISIGHPERILDLVEPDTVVIGIDEGQFFGPGIVLIVMALVNSGKVVIVAGLKQDFRGELFGSMGDLMVQADDLVHLNAVCNVCGGVATMTQRLIDGKPARWDSPQILVGAHDYYEARCRKHHEVPGKPD